MKKLLELARSNGRQRGYLPLGTYRAPQGEALSAFECVESEFWRSGAAANRRGEEQARYEPAP
jgi:hypothetical protein